MKVKPHWTERAIALKRSGETWKNIVSTLNEEGYTTNRGNRFQEHSLNPARDLWKKEAESKGIKIRKNSKMINLPVIESSSNRVYAICGSPEDVSNVLKGWDKSWAA